MPDLHLLPPDEADLPSRRMGWAIGSMLLLMWGLVLGMAIQQRTAEVADSARQRALDPSTLTVAPPAKYPGGVDARALDANRPTSTAAARRHTSGGQPPGPADTHRLKGDVPPAAHPPAGRP